MSSWMLSNMLSWILANSCKAGLGACLGACLAPANVDAKFTNPCAFEDKTATKKRIRTENMAQVFVWKNIVFVIVVLVQQKKECEVGFCIGRSKKMCHHC
mmetsp:Transcript_25180/g.35482  ORF Transcript_25180/g.35482 Transcript_25180/m.35482 type:complete len:100 (+) Transcript_25180:832-1131(+)